MISTLRSALFLFLTLLFGNFKCVEADCERSFQLRDWTSAWLDNAGSEPLVADSLLPREAFGIRLHAQFSNDGQDTIPDYDAQSCTLIPAQPLREIQVFALEGFDAVAAGENISARFKVRERTYSNLQYLALNDLATLLGQFQVAPESKFQIDLLMVEPPDLPGNYRFSVKIQFDRQNSTIQQDTTIILPTVTLQ